MKITDVLIPEAISVNLSSKTKDEVIEELVMMLFVCAEDILSDKVAKDKLMTAILERESLSSTGMSNGLAIPHAKISGIDRILIGVGISKQGVDFNSVDKEVAKIFFILISPKEAGGDHVKVLAQITRILKKEEARQALLACNSKEEIIAFINQREVLV